MAYENRGFKHKRGESVRRSIGSLETKPLPPGCLSGSQPGGAHPSVPCIRPIWRRPRANELPGCFLTGKSLICICNRDSSVSVASTSAWRAVNSDAWSCLTEAFTCYLHGRAWRRGTECQAPSILAASGPQALPEIDIHWNICHLLIATSLPLTWLTHIRHW